ATRQTFHSKPEKQLRNIRCHLTKVVESIMHLRSNGGGGGSSSTQAPVLRAVAEAVVGYTLILITLWSPPPIRNYVALAAAFWIFGSLLLSGKDGVSSGFGLPALGRCSWAVGLSLAAAAAVVALSAHLGTLNFESHLAAGRPPLLGYLLWSLIQQMILQCFILARLLMLLRRPGVAIVMASLLFSAAH